MLQFSALVRVDVTSTMLFIAILNGEKATKNWELEFSQYVF